jgi:hypothetical protein
MTIVIRPADLKSDRQLIIDLLSRFLTPFSDGRRFSWLYENNPAGIAKAWLAHSEEAIGMACAFPRRVCIAGRGALSWVLGDFCVDDKFRSLGPALQLQRICLAAAETEHVPICYDFPSASMVAVYKRLGFGVNVEMLRFAKPLRVDRKVKELVKSPLAQRIVSCVGNALMKATSAKPKADSRLQVAIHEGSCGDEFTVLEQEQRGTLGFYLERSAEYLNWRYIDNPLVRHEIVTARRNGRLVGYIVWTQAGDNAFIVDLFCEQDAAIVRHLAAEIVVLAQKRYANSVNVWIEKSHPWRSVFVEMGFRLRESAPMMILPSKSFAHKIHGKPTGCYLMQGDRDS